MWSIKKEHGKNKFAWWNKGARLKSKKHHSLIVVGLWALKFCTMNITSAKKNVVYSQNILIKSLAQAGEVVQHVYMCRLMCLTWSSGGVYADCLDSNLWYYLLSSYKSCIIECLHKQKYLIGLARTRLWLLKIMHFIKCMFCSAPVNGALITPSWM